MGRVVLAEHVLMKTRHAIKLLHDQLSKNDMIVQRFINEARAAGAIGHRNVVEITHVDQIEGGGPWYLVMKYLEGQTLTGLLRARRAPLEQRLIVHIIGEALNGLQAAHDRQIIHRDLKPDNVYLTAAKGDPHRTIILDFGVAQLGHDAGLLTRTGALIGTPQYMAPEQHRGAAITDRVDIWAIGAIIYEMATGRQPYQDDSTERNSLTGPELFHRMMSRPVVDPRYYNPALTEGFARAMLMALEVDPAKRSLNPRALALMLAEATPGDGYQPSGLEILKAHADELLEGDHRLETLQLRVPLMEATPATPEPGRPTEAPVLQVREPSHPIGYGSGAQPQQMAPQTAAHPSTLGAMASQSFRVAQAARPRRPWLAVGIGVVLVTVIGVVVLVRQQAPKATEQDAASVASGNSRLANTPAPVHVPMPTSMPTPTSTHHDGGIDTVGGADAGVPDAAGDVASKTATVDPGPAAAPALAIHPHDAGVPDATRMAGTTTIAVDAGLAPSVVAAHPLDAGVPGAAPKPARAEPVATGNLKVVVLPWAEVWVDGKSLGQTPVHARVSVGSHRVRLKNDEKDKTVTVTVTSAKAAVIDETW